jgi:hypothetical protein
VASVYRGAMGVAAAVLGGLGLCSVLVGIPKFKPELFFGGGAASLMAVVFGIIGVLVFAAVLLILCVVKPGK